MGLEERREWLDAPAIEEDKDHKPKDRVCTLEIWCECLGNSQKSMRNMMPGISTPSCSIWKDGRYIEVTRAADSDFLYMVRKGLM